MYIYAIMLLCLLFLDEQLKNEFAAAWNAKVPSALFNESETEKSSGTCCEFLRKALTRKTVHARVGELLKRYSANLKSKKKTLLNFRTTSKSTAALGARGSVTKIAQYKYRCWPGH